MRPPSRALNSILLGTDNTLSAANDNVIRFNPNGTTDLTFGNLGIDGNPGTGRARVNSLIWRPAAGPIFGLEMIDIGPAVQ